MKEVREHEAAAKAAEVVEGNVNRKRGELERMQGELERMQREIKER